MSKIYTQSQAIDFIKKVFGDGKVFNQGKNIQVVCPMCKSFKGDSYDNAKLAIRTDVFLVHCWVCGYKSKNLLNLMTKFSPENLAEYKENFLNAEDVSEATAEQIKVPVALPEGFRFLVNTSSRDNYAITAKRYLKSRGITERSELWYWKFGITDEPNSKCKYRVIIPSYDEEGNLNYWTARSWLKKINEGKFGFRYKNPDNADRRDIIFNDLNIDWSKEITLVEGPFDLIKCNQNATAVLGSELDANWALFRKILANKTPTLLAFDNEPKAQKKQMKIAQLLSEFDIKVRIFENPYKDKDIGDMTKNEFNNLFEHAKIFSEEYLLKSKIASLI